MATTPNVVPRVVCPECHSRTAVIVKDEPWNRWAFCPDCEHVWDHSHAAK